MKSKTLKLNGRPLTPELCELHNQAEAETKQRYVAIIKAGRLETEVAFDAESFEAAYAIVLDEKAQLVKRLGHHITDPVTNSSDYGFVQFPPQIISIREGKRK